MMKNKDHNRVRELQEKVMPTYLNISFLSIVASQKL